MAYLHIHLIRVSWENVLCNTYLTSIFYLPTTAPWKHTTQAYGAGPLLDKVTFATYSIIISKKRGLCIIPQRE